MLAAFLVGWLLVVSGLAGLSGSELAPRQEAVDIGRGVKVTPAAGWRPADEVWDVGPQGVSFKKAGALVAFTAEEWTGSAKELLAREIEGLRADLGAFRALPASQVQVGETLSGRLVMFSGTHQGTRIEGELVVAAAAGTGVVMLAVAPFGQLVRLQSDLETMRAHLVVGR